MLGVPTPPAAQSFDYTFGAEVWREKLDYLQRWLRAHVEDSDTMNMPVVLRARTPHRFASLCTARHLSRAPAAAASAARAGSCRCHPLRCPPPLAAHSCSSKFAFVFPLLVLRLAAEEFGKVLPAQMVDETPGALLPGERIEPTLKARHAQGATAAALSHLSFRLLGCASRQRKHHRRMMLSVGRDGALHIPPAIPAQIRNIFFQSVYDLVESSARKRGAAQGSNFWVLYRNDGQGKRDPYRVTIDDQTTFDIVAAHQGRLGKIQSNRTKARARGAECLLMGRLDEDSTVLLGGIGSWLEGKCFVAEDVPSRSGAAAVCVRADVPAGLHARDGKGGLAATGADREADGCVSLWRIPLRRRTSHPYVAAVRLGLNTATTRELTLTRS